MKQMGKDLKLAMNYCSGKTLANGHKVPALLKVRVPRTTATVKLIQILCLRQQ